MVGIPFALGLKMAYISSRRRLRTRAERGIALTHLGGAHHDRQQKQHFKVLWVLLRIMLRTLK